MPVARIKAIKRQTSRERRKRAERLENKKLLEEYTKAVVRLALAGEGRTLGPDSEYLEERNMLQGEVLAVMNGERFVFPQDAVVVPVSPLAIVQPIAQANGKAYPIKGNDRRTVSRIRYRVDSIGRGIQSVVFKEHPNEYEPSLFQVRK